MEFGSPQKQQQRARQPISVPFLWEEKPGTPKRDWKMYNELPLISLPPPPPAKLVISVPFQWEEKPGKPLPLLSQPLLELPPDLPVSGSPLPFTSSINPFIGEEDEVSGWELEFSETDCHSSSGSSTAHNPGTDVSVLEFMFPLSSSNAGYNPLMQVIRTRCALKMQWHLILLQSYCQEHIVRGITIYC